MKLLTVDDARTRMLAEIAPSGAESVTLAQSIGRVLAEDVAAIRNQPPFTASAMDGWAVRHGDSPGPLKIMGESAAGHGFDATLAPGEAVRIFTGAAVPAGADAIVIQENATRDGDLVTVPAVPKGEHLRPLGGDFQAGTTLLTRGTRMDPWRLCLAASAGRAAVSVHSRPRLAILSTGEEIVEAPEVPGPFQIYDSGAPALRAMAEGWGAIAFKAVPVRDDLEAVIEAIRSAEADIVVTVGGASVGDHDLVRAAGAALGLSLRVESVAVRPGKPTFFGILGDGRPMLGLPGNPASAFVCAELFLKPILAAWQGTEAQPRLIQARAGKAFSANGPREHWMRARLSHDAGSLIAEPWPDQDSSLVSVFAGADALLRRQAGAPAVAEGELVEVLPLARA